MSVLTSFLTKAGKIQLSISLKASDPMCPSFKYAEVTFFSLDTVHIHTENLLKQFSKKKKIHIFYIGFNNNIFGYY